ncbi:helix-turn-helix domain-containing protein [Erwinia amylovora]|uniref:helix-turn-helix domain-containing protein n=1 Tax=Erwinia amylovora TaxID=552 RepID=UPI001444401D|nr:helix-turn-helix transcriptional regulator [Erwinia amylovora]
MTGFDLILWRRGLNWTQERAAEKLGISRTSLVKYEAGAAVPRTIELSTIALSLKEEWPVLEKLSKDKLLHRMKNEVLRINVGTPENSPGISQTRRY